MRLGVCGRTIGFLLGAATLLAACGSVEPGRPADQAAQPNAADTDATAGPTTSGVEPTVQTAPVEPTPTSPPAPPDPAPTVGLATLPEELDLRLTPVVNLDRPIDLAVRSGSPNLFIATKGGEVFEVSPGTGEIVSRLVDVGDQITDGSETGLLGLVFSPDGASLFLSYSDRNGDNNLVELAMDGGVPDPDSRRTLLVVQQPAANHNGGDIAFGPDGFLYLALGDGGGAGDPFNTGQDPRSLLGSVLRIDPRGEPYSIPEDNPFLDRDGAPEVFLWGVRNPWRISFDRLTGDLWIADVGQDSLEEVDVLYASEGGGRGANLGWSRVEGSAAFNATNPPAEDYVRPIFEYGREGGCSITGGYVYRGQALPELFGSYIFGDFCSGLIWGIASSQEQGLVGRFDLGVQAGTAGLASFGEGPDAELYILSFDGTVYRLESNL